MSSWNNSGTTRRIFTIFNTRVFFENLLIKFKFRGNRTRAVGTLCEFLSYLVEFFVEWIIFQTKLKIKSKQTFYIQSFFFRKSCQLWWSQMIKWRMRFAYWIPKATESYSEYVILIAFLLQQWLHESASMLTIYVHCLSYLLSLETSNPKFRVRWNARLLSGHCLWKYLHNIRRHLENSSRLERQEEFGKWEK